MINREAIKTLKRLAEGFPIVGITGPRQSGKTTLARFVFKDKRYVSLEEPDTLEFATQDPRRFLDQFPNGAILDEVQRVPSLFSYLQTRMDDIQKMGHFILTGSQQFGLLSHITQTLAGRIGLLQLLPFSYSELKSAGIDFNSLDEALYKGLYPPLYDRKVTVSDWYSNYVQTYVERDVRQIINIKDLNDFQRFLKLCAGRMGQLLNLSSLGNDCGIKHNTANQWLSVLEASYIVFRLSPHSQNFFKRVIKSPKLYFYDPGLAAWLLGIRDIQQLSLHPSRSFLFEGWMISEICKTLFNAGLPSNLYFWRDHIGNEIDLLIDKGQRLIPIEIKSGQTITSDFFTILNKWKRWAGKISGPSYLFYGGNEDQKRSETEIISWRNMTSFVQKL